MGIFLDSPSYNCEVGVVCADALQVGVLVAHSITIALCESAIHNNAPGGGVNSQLAVHNLSSFLSIVLIMVQ